MTIPAGTLAAVFVLVLICGGVQAAERGRETRGATPTSCTDAGESGECISVASQEDIFCIAVDRCSAVAPRQISALIRYDARMDALR